MASPSRTRKRTEWLKIGSGNSYAHRVHRPLQCLIFITPLLLFYQIASTLHPWSPDQQYSSHVVAFVLMLKFFAIFGAAGNVLPLLAVVAILISWHLARKDPWDVSPKLYLGMFGESIVWAIPIFVIGLAVTSHMRAAAAVQESMPWQSEVVLSVGAGIYEELLFRLIAIIALNILLVDVFELSLQVAIPIIIIASALLFSLYHLLGNEPFNVGTFSFRCALGVYLAGIFIYRGFGITVWTHAVYDLIVVAVGHLHSR